MEPGLVPRRLTSSSADPIGSLIGLLQTFTALGLLIVFFVNGLIVQQNRLYIVVPFLIGHGIVLTVAKARLSQGLIRQSLLLVIGTSWQISVAVAFLIPFLWPVMVLTVLSPLLLATSVLFKRMLISLSVAGVVVMSLVCAIGLANVNGGVVELNKLGQSALVIGSLLTLSGVICYVVWQNDRSLNRALTHAESLNENLRASHSELFQSRRRIVSAADRERIRIERDLHDGAQQRLVGVSLKLKALGSLDAIAAVPENEAALAAVGDELKSAIVELRELAHGIYPPLLRMRGLGESLKSVRRRSTASIEFESCNIGRYDESVETALYYVALEALANAVKHAPGAKVSLSLKHERSLLKLQIADNGPGFDTKTKTETSGHINMADRVASVNGDFTIQSEIGAGTVLLAAVPVGGCEKATTPPR